MSAQYSQEQFDQDVSFFNRACGRSIPTTQEEFDREVLMQQRLVQEESTETMMALINDDVVEILDGLVDTLFTTSWLVHLITSCADKGFGISQMLGVWLDCIPINQVGAFFDESVVLEAMHRVALNNASKFTADRHRAEIWAASATEYVLSEVVVDDVVYFCLKDQSGKVRKHLEYAPVYLGDLI